MAALRDWLAIIALLVVSPFAMALGVGLAFVVLAIALPVLALMAAHEFLFGKRVA